MKKMTTKKITIWRPKFWDWPPVCSLYNIIKKLISSPSIKVGDSGGAQRIGSGRDTGDRRGESGKQAGVLR